jgi:hypothetical protein
MRLYRHVGIVRMEVVKLLENESQRARDFIPSLEEYFWKMPLCFGHDSVIVSFAAETFRIKVGQCDSK